MYTSVYVANGEIQAVTGEAGASRINVRQFASEPLPEGSLVNGVITNEEAIKNAISAMKQKNPGIKFKKVRLTIGSSLVYAKRVRVPKLSDKKLVAAARGEFSGMEDAETLVYDSARLDPDKDGDVMLVSAVRRELLDSYISVFKGAGVDVASINTILGAENKLTGALPEVKGKSYILVVMDGSNMDAVLYINGGYRFSSRLRLIAERGDPAISNEVQRTVSSMMQFNYAEKSGVQITDVYFAGLKEGEESTLVDIKNAMNLNTHEITSGGDVVTAPEGFDLARFIYPLGNLIPAKSDLDFKERLSDSPEQESKTRARWAAIVPLAAAVVILGAVFAVISVRLVNTQAQAYVLNAYVTNEQNVAAYDKTNTLTASRNAVYSYLDELNADLSAVASYPKLNSALFGAVESCTGANYSISSYSYTDETGVLTLGADAVSELYMPELVQRLRNTGLFAGIGYTGYTGDNDGLYHATINCLVAPSASEEGAE